MSPSRRTRWAVVLMYAVALTTSALVPGGTPGLAAVGPLGLGLDKWSHFGSFAVVGALGVWAAGERRWLAVAALALALGAAIELAQGVVPGRLPDPADFLADALGVAIGVALAVGVARWSAR